MQMFTSAGIVTGRQMVLSTDLKNVTICNYIMIVCIAEPTLFITGMERSMYGYTFI